MPHRAIFLNQDPRQIDRVYGAYPHLNDDAFVAQHRDAWLAG